MKYELEKTLKESGYSFLLPIQEKAIPQVLSGKNLFIQAETGSGKTLAYLIPVLEKTDAESNDTQALIITPTRELAMQVSAVANKIALHTKHHIITVIGGLDIHKQENALCHRPTIIIGTPGRLKDLFEQNKLNLHHLKITVLDEVDQIISTGQRKEVDFLLSKINAQVVATSATSNEQIKAFMPSNYEEIIQDTSHINKNIDAFVLKTSDRKHSLLKLLKTQPIEQAIIFTNYKNDANELAEWLKKKNILSSSFSSFYEEKERIRILKDYKAGNIRVLVATDAAARGLDLTNISHIIHYDIPLDTDTFIHRSGRSAHQGNKGITITLIREKDTENPVTQYIIAHSTAYNPNTKCLNDLSIPLQKKKEESNSMILKIQAGRKDKLRPKDIIGALCSYIPFEKIGVLEIQDNYSTITILENNPHLFSNITHISIKGKKRKITFFDNA